MTYAVVNSTTHQVTYFDGQLQNISYTSNMTQAEVDAAIALFAAAGINITYTPGANATDTLHAAQSALSSAISTNLNFINSINSTNTADANRRTEILNMAGMDLGLAMWALMTDRTEQQDKQMAILMEAILDRNVKMKSLNKDIKIKMDEKSALSQNDADGRAAKDADIQALKAELDAANSSQQMDLAKMQDLSGKRNESTSLLSTFIKIMAQSRETIVQKMG